MWYGYIVAISINNKLFVISFIFFRKQRWVSHQYFPSASFSCVFILEPNFRNWYQLHSPYSY